MLPSRNVIAHGWKGATYGLRFTTEDRTRHFDPRWTAVILHLGGGQTVTTAVSSSFWRTCPELRSAEIGRWFMANGAAPWPKGTPPRVTVTHLDGNRFEAHLNLVSN